MTLRPFSARVCIIGSPRQATIDRLTLGGEPPLVLLDDRGTLGERATQAMEAGGTRDVLLVRGDSALPAGPWHERLRAAASDPLAAGAVALTAPDVPPTTALTQQSPGGHPRIATSSSPVLYLTRAGIDVIGLPDAQTSSWPALVTDLLQRAILGGLTVVAADVVAAPVGEDPLPDDLIDGTDHPWLAATVDDEPSAGPATRALARMRRVAFGLSVTVDCRSVGPIRTGTQTHASGLALALAEIDDVRLRVLVAHDLDPRWRERLLDAGATLLDYEDAVRGTERTSVVHRPQQVSTSHDLALLLPLGERLVITHQDLIGYRNPGYHASTVEWMRYRRATRYALSLADRVLFFSEHARADAVTEDVVDPTWTDVVGIGVGAQDGHERHERPAALGNADDDAGFLLCLGTDLRHKNRLFALRLLGALRDRGWQGRLVLAGPHAAHGGTREEEKSLAMALALTDHVVDLGAVPEPGKLWLLAHAAMVVYPTVDEGFGLLPFEAATAGTPTAHSGLHALGEVLPGCASLLVPWNAQASADRVLAVLRDDRRRDDMVSETRAAAARRSWRDAAARVVASYEQAITSPRRAVAWEARDRLETEAELQALRAFRDAVGADGARLVGHDALLDGKDRRALLALAAHPRIGQPVLAMMRAGYRLGRRRATAIPYE